LIPVSFIMCCCLKATSASSVPFSLIWPARLRRSICRLPTGIPVNTFGRVGLMPMPFSRTSGIANGGNVPPVAISRRNAANAHAAKQRASDVARVIAELQASGAESLRAIAAGLNARGIPTARGEGQWVCGAGGARDRAAARLTCRPVIFGGRGKLRLEELLERPDCPFGVGHVRPVTVTSTVRGVAPRYPARSHQR
jgi:hypothetical protein